MKDLYRKSSIDSLKGLPQPKGTKDLWEKEGYLKNIWNSSSVGVIIIDTSTYKIADANPFSMSLISIPKEEVIGHICNNFICTLDLEECILANFTKILGSSETFLICGAKRKIPVIKSVVQLMRKGRVYLIEIFVLANKQKIIDVGPWQPM